MIKSKQWFLTIKEESFDLSIYEEVVNNELVNDVDLNGKSSLSLMEHTPIDYFDDFVELCGKIYKEYGEEI